MQHKDKKKTSLKTKLATALAVVNALNVGAAVALPYASTTQCLVADGAKVEKIVDGVAGAMYGTAHAAHQESTYDGEGHGETYNNLDDGFYIVKNGGQTSGTNLSGTETTSGVISVCDGGIGKDNIIGAGGTQIVYSGGTVQFTDATDPTFNTDVHGRDAGGVLELHGGAIYKFNKIEMPYSNYALQGGTLRLVDGASIDNFTINNGTLELGEGGKATRTVLFSDDGNHPEEIIKNGALSEGAYVDVGGTQTVSSGGTSKQANINGGLQNVMSGGLSEGATVNGGTQKVMGGGSASGIVMAGGTVSVEDDATAQIAEATGGTLELLETGLATAVFGGLETGTFNIATLTATGDSVRLGIGGNGGAAASAVGKTLNITNLNGNAKFYVNTDLANNLSDKINITNSTKAQSTILVNYDQTVAATGQAPAGAKALVATVGDNNATFVGGETTIGGYKFTPTLLQEGTNWYIMGAENAGPSGQMYASLDTATWQAIAWRDSNFVIGSRMAQLHHNPASAHQNDFWVDFTRGRTRTNNFGHAMNRTYDRVSVGYDRLVGHGWTVGLAYGYEKGSEGYEKGSGDSTGNVVTAYATWQGARGNYVDMTVKGGQLESDFTVQDDNQIVPSDGRTRATGAGVSAVYGHRFENASAFYVEPHAGFYWSHLGGYDYQLSDGSDVSVDGCNSFVGNLGVNVGKRLGKGEVYARADFMHDFSGNVRVSMTKAGLNNTMENPLHDNWFNVAVGYRQNYERLGWYAEAGCQSIGSRESSGDWVWKAGVEFKF